MARATVEFHLVDNLPIAWRLALERDVRRFLRIDPECLLCLARDGRHVRETHDTGASELRIGIRSRTTRVGE